MEAKDTVMGISSDEADKCRGWASQRRKFIEEKLQAQAEISFKIGYEEGYKAMSEENRLSAEQAYIAGYDEGTEFLDLTAETQFKAGHQAGLRQQDTPTMDAEARLADEEYRKKFRKEYRKTHAEIQQFKAGMREVVEWLREYGYEPDDIHIGNKDEWQAKLKEWGIDG